MAYRHRLSVIHKVGTDRYHGTEYLYVRHMQHSRGRGSVCSQHGIARVRLARCLLMRQERGQSDGVTGVCQMFLFVVSRRDT